MRRAIALALLVVILTLLVVILMPPSAGMAAATVPPDQSATGRVTGVVRDAMQAVVVGAKVELKSADSAATWTRETNGKGQYTFDGIPPGLYQLTVIVSGFQIVVVRDVRVDAGRETVVNVTLHIPHA
jgi:hypothetical protein